MSQLFKLRGKLSSTQGIVLGVIGIVLVILIWFLLTAGESPMVSTAILPSPGQVLDAFGSLYTENQIIKNTLQSLSLNLAGYIEAIAISIPVGFLIGLLPLFRGTFQRQVDAVRYLPLTALTGLFIVWFGLGTSMKVHFLAFGILIYLLPVVVQRIDEVKDVYLKTVYTLGATDWQTVRTVYFPSVMSRLSDDIRVLTAISWTYIIIAESLGNQGGIGAMIWRTGQRQGRVDKVFAILIIIVIIGIVQDRLFIYMDRKFFPHKYQGDHNKTTGFWSSLFTKIGLSSSGIVGIAWKFGSQVVIWLVVLAMSAFTILDYLPVNDNLKLFANNFGETAWAVHFIVLIIVGYKLMHLFKPKR